MTHRYADDNRWVIIEASFPDQRYGWLRVTLSNKEEKETGGS